MRMEISNLRLARVLLAVSSVSLFSFLEAPSAARNLQDSDPSCQTIPSARWGSFLHGDAINALWVDEDQQVVWAAWSGAEEGLARYDGREWDEEIFDSDLMLEGVEVLLGDGAGGVWIGTEVGLIHFNGTTTRQFDRDDGLSDPWIRSLAIDGDGGLWVGTLRGGLNYFNGEAFDRTMALLEGQPSRSIGAILPGESGSVYFGAGTEVFFLTSEREIHRFGADDGLDGSSVQALARNSRGELFVGAAGGLHRLRDGVFTAVTLASGIDEEEPDILAMVDDQNGGLWLGTTSGLWHFDGARIDDHQTEASDKLFADRVQLIQSLDDGTLWLGTSGGLNRWDPDSWRLYPEAGRRVREITGYQDRLWATSDEGLLLLDDHNCSLIWAGPAHGLSLADETVWFGAENGLYRVEAGDPVMIEGFGRVTPEVIREGESGSLWIGTDSGLFHFREGEVFREYHSIDGLAGEIVEDLLVEKEIIWIATINGLSRLRISDGMLLPNINWTGGFRANTVRAMNRGPDGSLWVGTGAGLRRLPPGADPKLPESWLFYARVDGLGNDSINAIWADLDGQVWVGTSRGLSGLDDNGTLAKGDDIWVTIRSADGLGSDRVRALWRDADGNLWAGTDQGLAQHVPSAFDPQLTILDLETEEEPRLEYPWNQEILTLDFAGGSLISDQFSYRYKLVQDDQSKVDDWVSVNGSLQAFDIEPNTSYELIVQALDLDLHASPPISTSFSVESIPLLARRWIQITLFVMASGSAAALVAARPIRRWWYRRRAFQYRDLEMVLIPDGIEGSYRVRYSGPDLANESSVVSHINHESFVQSQHRLESLQASAADSRKVGNQLYNALFPEDTLNEWVRQRQARKQLRYRLRLGFDNAPELNILPWELQRDDKFGFLGQRTDFALVRYVQPPDDWEPPPLERNLRILVVMATPDAPSTELPKLNMVAEKRALDRIASEVPGIEMDFVVGYHASALIDEPAVEGDMVYALESKLKADQRWDVLHFSCHAGKELVAFREEDREAVVLYLEGPGGTYSSLNQKRLGGLLSTLDKDGKNPRLAVLNACRTAEAVNGLVDVFLDNHVGAVVGMQWPVSELVAARFTQEFYASLARDGQVDYAISAGRSQIATLGTDQPEWAAPILVTYMKDGFIFRRGY